MINLSYKERENQKPLRSDHTPDNGRWNPWRTLVEDYPDWRVISDYDLGPRLRGLTSFTRKRIWLCSTMTEVERDSTLAHELVHVERGEPPHDQVGARDEERIVEEITARRLIPFRALAKVMAERPDAIMRIWAWLLCVDLPTLTVRLITLSAVERAALAQVRGGPLPTMPFDQLWDDPHYCTSPVETRQAAAASS